MKKAFALKSLVVALAMVGGISSAMAALPSGASSATVQGGTVEFKGTVVDAACAVSADTADQVVQLDQVKLDTFTAKDSAAGQKKPFTIELVDCDTSTYTQASVTFNGNAAGSDEAGVLANTAGAGSATGIGIQIYDNTGAALDLGTESATTKLINGNGNTLNFSADYYQTADTVTAGSVDTTATFNITYQ
ncbi:fimbrial protein [Kluyvera sichuanensis]|uniref:fimbrial protein n=1 Tax=Kluyvera sichuanensis TaxID=2725494 RepID=UPI002FD0B087